MNEEIDIKKIEKIPIVSRNLIVYVLIYSLFAIISQIMNTHAKVLLYKGFSFSDFIIITLFILMTTLMFIISFSLLKTLSKAFSQNNLLLYIGLVILFLKFGINIISFSLSLINGVMISGGFGTTLFIIISQLRRFLNLASPISNIMLLTIVVIYISINKLKSITLWIILAVSQVSLIIFNITLSILIRDKIIYESSNVINLLLLILKLVIVNIIVITYYKNPIIKQVEEKSEYSY